MDDEGRYSDLLQAARVILGAGIEDEDEIVPTLVCAANRREVASLKGAYKSLASGGEYEALSKVTSLWFSEAFDRLAGVSRKVDGVPILREAPAAVTGVEDSSGYIGEIVIDVFKRSVRLEDIAGVYARFMERNGVSSDPERGQVAWKFHNDSKESFLRILVRPETRSVDSADGRIMAISAGAPRFPEPHTVAGVFGVLRGSRKEGKPLGYIERLAGRERGPRRQKPAQLVLACVAWYVGGRKAVTPDARPRAAGLLNRSLLSIGGEAPVLEVSSDSSDPLWTAVRSVEPKILRLQRAINRCSKTQVNPNPE